MINTQESKVQLEYIEKCKALVAERYDHQPAIFYTECRLSDEFTSDRDSCRYCEEDGL